jgi:phosphoribosyl-ATP pyrophosphohydrolase
MGIKPDDIWAEIRRREEMFGIAEKLPKNPERAQTTESPGRLP